MPAKGKTDQLATLVWSFLFILEKLRGVGGGGTSLRICQLLDRRFETSPIHTLNVDEESRGTTRDRRFGHKLTLVLGHPILDTVILEALGMQTVLNLGVDVAKDTVVVASADQRWPVQQVRNQRSALRAWLKTVPAGSRIGLESTGSYHELLADLAHASGYIVYLLNPMETRHYFKALGARAKTDRVDALLLARMIAQEHAGLRAYTPPSSGRWIG